MMPMHPNAETIRRFYACFAKRDGDGMAAYYDDGVHFSDEVFPDLRGARAGAMWRMLCERAVDLRIEVDDVEADDRSGRARWQAWYTFTATGRKVHNVVDARFDFGGGRIMRHRDTFDFWRWSRQALGPMGWLLGWSTFVKSRVRANAARSLEAFERRRAQADIEVRHGG